MLRNDAPKMGLAVTRAQAGFIRRRYVAGGIHPLANRRWLAIDLPGDSSTRRPTHTAIYRRATKRRPINGACRDARTSRIHPLANRRWLGIDRHADSSTRRPTHTAINHRATKRRPMNGACRDARPSRIHPAALRSQGIHPLAIRKWLGIDLHADSSTRRPTHMAINRHVTKRRPMNGACRDARTSRIHPAALRSQGIHPLAIRRWLGIDLPGDSSTRRPTHMAICRHATKRRPMNGACRDACKPDSSGGVM
jgi:hypothetical protein